MGEFMFSDWLMIQRGGTNRLPNYTFEHSSVFPCDSMSAESTDEIPSEISRPFAMLCTIQSAVCIKDLCNSSRIGFPKTVLLEYQPPPPYSQVNTRCEVWWNEPVGLFTDIGHCEEFACATKCYVGFYVDLVDKDKKLPFCILERVSHCFGLESSHVCCM